MWQYVLFLSAFTIIVRTLWQPEINVTNYVGLDLVSWLQLRQHSKWLYWLHSHIGSTSYNSVFHILWWRQKILASLHTTLTLVILSVHHHTLRGRQKTLASLHTTLTLVILRVRQKMLAGLHPTLTGETECKRLVIPTEKGRQYFADSCETYKRKLNDLVSHLDTYARLTSETITAWPRLQKVETSQRLSEIFSKFQNLSDEYLNFLARHNTEESALEQSHHSYLRKTYADRVSTYTLLLSVR